MHSVFICPHTEPCADAQHKLICDSCGDPVYTTEANAEAAARLEAVPTCPVCALVLMSLDDTDVVFGGVLANGRLNGSIHNRH